MYLYLTEVEDFHYLEDRDFSVWSEELVYGNWEDGPNQDGSRTKTLDILVPESVQNNGSWYLHVFIAKAGSTLDSDSKEYKEQAITYQSTCEGGLGVGGTGEKGWEVGVVVGQKEGWE